MHSLLHTELGHEGRTSRRRRGARIGVAFAAMIVASGGIAGSAAARPDASQAKHSKLERQLRAVKAAVARYHNPKRARQDGYLPPPGPISETCVESPAGGSGIHYDNPKLMQDDRLDIRRPEILLYAPDRGKLRLVAVEYFRNDADQNTATSDDRPRLFGRSFQGPMPGHHPQMGIHYDLHVWVFKRNPRGRFAEFNPRIDCP